MAGPRRNALLQTELTPTAEALFQQQAAARLGDTQDYDLRGAWAQQGGGDLGGAHLTDTFKLPNHPTFSSGSRYSTPEQPGGHWAEMPDGRWVFLPSQTNYEQFGRANLEDYFRRFEPNALLLRR
jgi:hypothetical protein